MCSRQMTLTLTAGLALRRLALLAALPSLLVTNVVAQVRHALCTDPSFSWAFNSLEESPCQIGEQVGKACGDDNFRIPPASQNSTYIGIGATFATECVCNTVYYSLLNVCAACQGAGVSVWQEWSRNCTLTYDTRFPRPIPNDTAVPHYAYNALFRNGTFNFAAAIRDTGPEVTSETEPSTTSTSGPSSTSSAQDDGGSSNTGAIAGGVVGGVIGLAIIIGGAILFVIRRRLNRSAPNNIPIDEMGALHPFDLNSSPAPPKTYDPKDPSTFPSSISHASVTGDHANGSYGRHSPALGAQNTYRGVPEL